MNSSGPRILLAATVPVHFWAFHLPWIGRLRELGCIVAGAADRISEMPEFVEAFNEVHDIPFSRNPLNVGAVRAAGKAIERVLRDQQIDLVHVHTPVAGYVARKHANAFRASKGLKTIYTAHGFHFHDRGAWHTNFIFQLLEKRAARWTDYLVVINRDDEAAAHRLKLMPPERLVYMPGVGIDLNQFSRASVSAEQIQGIRGELKLAPSDYLVTMVAEFTRNKRHADVVQAFARLKRRDVHLALVGDGPTRPQVERLAQQMGIGDIVHFVGYRRDVPIFLCAANCAVLASGREGLPRSVMEALCLEVPVIGSDARGLRDLLAGGGGVTFPVGDVKKIAELIHQMIENPRKAREMGAAGRRSMEPYALVHVLALHEQLYRRAMGDRFPASP